MNALVGAPGGVLYAASNANTSLFSITPSPFAARIIDPEQRCRGGRRR
jgi:hypothetical protein